MPRKNRIQAVREGNDSERPFWCQINPITTLLAGLSSE